MFSCAKPNHLELQPKTETEKPNPQKSQQTGTCNLFFKETRLCVEIIWEKFPNEPAKGSFILKYFVQETPAKFIDPRQKPAVVLWMPSTGHGSSLVKVEKISTGEYKATEVFFDMPGEWEIRLQLKDGKDVVDQVIKKITI